MAKLESRLQALETQSARSATSESFTEDSVTTQWLDDLIREHGLAGEVCEPWVHLSLDLLRTACLTTSAMAARKHRLRRPDQENQHDIEP